MKALLILAATIIITLKAFAQQKTGTHKYSAHKTTTKKKAVKKEVHAAYYPDFYTFYDSSRKSYVYWDTDQWRVSPDRPSFMKNVGGDKVRVEILHDESMAGFPESHYEQYLRLYPAQPVSPTVPVPLVISKRSSPFGNNPVQFHPALE